MGLLCVPMVLMGHNLKLSSHEPASPLMQYAMQRFQGPPGDLAGEVAIILLCDLI